MLGEFLRGLYECPASELFEHFKLSILLKHSVHSKHFKRVKRVELVESVRLSRVSRGSNELVLKIELEELGRHEGVMN